MGRLNMFLIRPNGINRHDFIRGIQYLTNEVQNFLVTILTRPTLNLLGHYLNNGVDNLISLLVLVRDVGIGMETKELWRITYWQRVYKDFHREFVAGLRELVLL